MHFLTNPRDVHCFAHSSNTNQMLCNDPLIQNVLHLRKSVWKTRDITQTHRRQSIKGLQIRRTVTEIRLKNCNMIVDLGVSNFCASRTTYLVGFPDPVTGREEMIG